jgi:conjugative transfer signal peptidase TraF
MIATLIRKAAIGSFALVAFAGVVYAAGLRINMTESLPLGFYWRTFEPIERGSYVIFCPPTDNSAFHLARERHYIEYGNCSGRFGSLLKRVAGVPGDHIDVDADGVRVNGTLLPNSAPRTADRGGHPLPVIQLHAILPGDNLLLMSDYTPWSFDARYFGPIARSAIRAHVKPLWTW